MTVVSRIITDRMRLARGPARADAVRARRPRQKAKNAAESPRQCSARVFCRCSGLFRQFDEALLPSSGRCAQREFAAALSEVRLYFELSVSPWNPSVVIACTESKCSCWITIFCIAARRSHVSGCRAARAVFWVPGAWLAAARLSVSICRVVVGPDLRPRPREYPFDDA